MYGTKCCSSTGVQYQCNRFVTPCAICLTSILKPFDEMNYKSASQIYCKNRFLYLGYVGNSTHNSARYDDSLKFPENHCRHTPFAGKVFENGKK